MRYIIRLGFLPTKDFEDCKNAYGRKNIYFACLFARPKQSLPTKQYHEMTRACIYKVMPVNQ